VDSLLALIKLSVRQMAGGKKLLVVALLLVGAAALAALVRNAGNEPREGWGVVSTVMLTFLFLQALVILIPLLFATSLLRDEIEDGTLVYLFTRPVPKWKVILAKYAASTVVCGALVVAGMGLFQLAFLVPGGGGEKEFGWATRTLAFMGAGFLGVVTYGALFTLVGLISKRGLIFGVAYGFLSEFLMTLLPAVIKKLTVMHYLRSIALSGLDLEKLRIDDLPGLSDLSGATPSVAVLVVAAALLLGASCVLVSKKEFLTLKGADSE
jgi:ABC-2 type transport system permease protein